MTLLEIVKDLEIILSDLVFSGIDNIDYSFIDKIEDILKETEKNKISNLNIFLNDFLFSIREYKQDSNENNLRIVIENIGKLDFYIRNVLHYDK